MQKKIRIILDTNWYISATINKSSRRKLYQLITDKRFIILLSSEIVEEYRQVISRDKFRKIINPFQVSRFINVLTSVIELVNLKSDLKGSRDIKDNFLLSLSADGNADYLITGDEDLLVLQKTGSTQILTLKAFLETIS